MSLRFVVHGMTLVILTTSAIVYLCNATTKEADPESTTPREPLQIAPITEGSTKQTVCDNSIYKDTELSLTNEYVLSPNIKNCVIPSLHFGRRFVEIQTGNDEIRATNTHIYYENVPHEYHRRHENFSLDWRWLCNESYTTSDDHSGTHPSKLKLIEADTRHLYDLMVKKSSSPEARAQIIMNITRLCSHPPTIFRDSDLRCRYNFQNDPFLLIAPLKEEIISADPKITIFRDVLYESEIKKLIKEGKNRLFREKKVERMKNKTSQNDPNTDCPRELAFFRDTGELVEIDTITRRTRDITGRQKNYVQPWQITFYETGGYFPMHSDLDHVDEEEVEGQGQRMATVSFILNNADVGGTTIFPSINIRPDPKKGDAIMWYNVREDGSEDIRMRHAMCPVLAGCRWEFVKRINQKTMMTE